MNAPLPKAVFDPSLLSLRSQNADVVEALRWVLVLSLDRDAAAACLQERDEDPVCLWPGTLYGMLAAATFESTVLWHRVRAKVEAELAPELEQHRDKSLMELSGLLHDAAVFLTRRELATLIWLSIRKDAPWADAVAVRFARESQVLIARGLAL